MSNELPPLPMGAIYNPGSATGCAHYSYTADQMRAYARAALAQPVPDAPEPAGWFEGPHGAFRANPAYRIAWPPQSVKWHIPVYIAAAHPQPAPLTDAQIDEVTLAQWGPLLGSMKQAHRAYARAVLAAALETP